MIRGSTSSSKLLIALMLVSSGFVVSSILGQGQAEKVQLAPIGTAFTYQGKLESVLSGGDVNSVCDFQFELWDEQTIGISISGPIPVNNVDVNDGLFTVRVDFGVDAFAQDERWLAISVRCPAGSGVFQPLDPRQRVTPAPQSLYSIASGAAQTAATATVADSALVADAVDWDNITNMPPDFRDGTDDVDGAPVGTVMAWLKSFPGTPILSDEWVECNGQLISDSSSDYVGMNVPNLNALTKILQGNTVSGGTGNGLDSSPYGLFTNHPGGGNWPLNSQHHSQAVDRVRYNGGATAITNPTSDFGASRFYRVVWIMKIK